MVFSGGSTGGGGGGGRGAGASPILLGDQTKNTVRAEHHDHLKEAYE